MPELPEPLAGLVREHRMVEALLTDARHAIDATTAHNAEPAVIGQGIEAMRDLEAFLAIDLAVHIAKEEEVLFPAMRYKADDTPAAVEDMLAQHDEIRLKEEQLQRAMEALDGDTHEQVTHEAARLYAGLVAAAEAPTIEQLVALRDTVMRLDWILQGHFGDEEDALFEPAPGWFTPEEFAAFVVRMQEIEQAWA